MLHKGKNDLLDEIYYASIQVEFYGTILLYNIVGSFHTVPLIQLKPRMFCKLSHFAFLKAYELMNYSWQRLGV